MPVGGKGKPAGGYRAGAKGSYGCDGYPTVSADGTVHGCHPTKARAQAQARAIWASTARKSISSVEKAMVSEGDFVVFLCEEDELRIGQVEFVMNEGVYGLTGSEYAMEATPEDPVLSIRLFEEEDGVWEAEHYTVAHKASEVVKIESIKVGQDIIVEMTSTPNGMMETEVDPMEMMDKAQMANAPYQDAQMDNEDGGNLQLAAKPKYEDMIKPRRGGSTPANPRLYASVVQAAKDKFDVYPSAVANGWVVQEYKRRGGTYKMEDMETEKRDYSGSARERMAGEGTAMPDGSFPIANRADLQNAIQSVGRAKDYGKAKAHIIRRARALNAMDMLPEDWRNMATKGMGSWSGSVFDLNPFVK